MQPTSIRAPSLRVLKYLRQLISLPNTCIPGISCVHLALPQYIPHQPPSRSPFHGYRRLFHSNHCGKSQASTTIPGQLTNLHSLGACPKRIARRQRRMNGSQPGKDSVFWARMNRRRHMNGRSCRIGSAYHVHNQEASRTYNQSQSVWRYSVPTLDYQRKRQRIRSRKGNSDTSWMRHLARKISQGDADGAEKFWHANRVGGRDLKDLRQASKALMRAYNEAGRWLDTIRLFKWNEVAAKLDERGKRRMRDVIPLNETGKYLIELTLRAKLQKKLVDHSTLKVQIGSRVQEVEKALDEIRRESSDKEFDVYCQELRDTLLKFQKIPTKFMEESVPVEELRKFIGDLSLQQPFTSPEESMLETGIDGETLNFCFEALLRRLDWEIILTLFYQYQPTVKFTTQTWEYVLCAYVNLDQIKKAQGLIRYTVFREISISPKCYSIMLSAMKVNGSWQKMVRYFGWLEQVSNSKVPAIYHIMIQTAVERGMREEANKYLKRMTEKGLSLTAETCGALLSSQAKVNDWDSLQNTLAIMDSQGFRIPIGSFNAVLNAYAEAKVYADTEMFFKSGLERGVVPDKFTYNIMIKASVYTNGAGAEGFLPYWLQQMIANGIRPDRFTFNNLFQDLRRNYGASASLLRRTYQRILRMQTSVKILDHYSKEMLLKTMHHENKRYRWTYTALRASGVQTREAIALRMASAIEANRPDDALLLWKETLHRGQTPSFQMIILALRASLAAKERSVLISEVLQLAKAHGLDVPHSIISVIRDSVRKLSREKATEIDDGFPSHDESTTLKYDKLYTRIEEVYKFLEKNALPVTHHVAVHSANRLIDAEQPHAAIQLLNQVARSKWGRRHCYDRVGYSVIMKAYCKARDLNGIKWTVERLIALRLRPTVAIYYSLHGLKDRFLRESDENQAAHVRIMIFRLRTHAAQLEQDARRKAEFLVDFIRGTVGITNKRRFGTNWPLVTLKYRKDKHRDEGEVDRTADELMDEPKGQTTKTTRYSFILRALEDGREGRKMRAKRQVDFNKGEMVVVDMPSSLNDAMTPTAY